MWNTLPNITGSFARDANLLGGFGLVVGPLTNTYHTPDLAWNRPQDAFTKHHRLVIATGIIDCYNVLDVLSVVGY